VVGGAALLLAVVSSTALAAHLALTLGATSSAALGERVVINSSGRTLYTLSPETSRHLLCKTGECLKRWPPLTVSSSATKLQSGAGLDGHLGILRRSNGTLQVTLRGLPLYRYSQDHAAGDVNGEGIHSFHGTWHAMTAAGGEHPRRATMTPATPSPAPPTPPPYPYPPY
jgi:predicted lipoprotein with Yx(FWY)xxD motif